MADRSDREQGQPNRCRRRHSLMNRMRPCSRTPSGPAVSTDCINRPNRRLHPTNVTASIYLLQRGSHPQKTSLLCRLMCASERKAVTVCSRRLQFMGRQHEGMASAHRISGATRQPNRRTGNDGARAVRRIAAFHPHACGRPRRNAPGRSPGCPRPVERCPFPGRRAPPRGGASAPG